MKLKKIGVLSAGIWAAIIALLVFAINSAVSWILAKLETFSGFTKVVYWNLTLSTVILTVLMSFVTWVIVAGVYNLLARYLGDVKVELK